MWKFVKQHVSRILIHPSMKLLIKEEFNSSNKKIKVFQIVGLLVLVNIVVHTHDLKF